MRVQGRRNRPHPWNRQEFRRPQGRFPALAVEIADAEIDGPEAAAVADRPVEMAFPGGAFIGRLVLVNDQRAAQAAPGSRKGALAVPGHEEQLQRPPVGGPGAVRHELAELGLLVRTLDQVRLVDDIDEVAHLRHAPGDPVHAEAQLPFPVAGLAVKQQKGFPQVEMRAVRVRAVISEEGRDREAAALLVLGIEFGLGREAARMRPLAGMQGGLGIPAAFQGEPAGDLGFDVRRLRRPAEQREREPGGSALQEPRAVRHQRTRFSPVFEKSRSLRSVPNR